MEGRTPTEKVHYVETLISNLGERFKALADKVNGQETDHSQLVHVVGELKSAVIRLQEQMSEIQKWKDELGVLTEIKTDIVVLKREVDKLEKVKDEWTRRIWAMAGPIAGAAVGCVLGYMSHR